MVAHQHRPESSHNERFFVAEITRDVGRQALVPPSTVRFAPVMYEASGLATNATSAATSSTLPNRPSAVLAFCGVAQSPAAGFKSVSIGPGWTLLTVMPRPPTSRDSPWVNIFTAPFVAE